LSNDTLGSFSVAIGSAALAAQNFTTATSSYNTAVGALAGNAITTAKFTTLVGGQAGDAITTSPNNTCIGYAAGTAITTGDGNSTMVGNSAGANVTTGSGNTLIGTSAGNHTVLLTTGDNNTCVGTAARTSIPNAENQIVIGYNFAGNGDNKVNLGSNSGYVWNSYTVNATWNQVSDERTKKNIQDDTLGLDFINEIRPVTFNWKAVSEIDPDFIEQTLNIGNGEKDTETVIHGLIAQEVKAAMDAVGNTTFNGWEDSVDGQAISREMFITPLIKAVQELSAQVTALQAEVNTLKGG